MSVEQSLDVPKVGENITDGMTGDWIHEVEREETVDTEGVNEEEVEEFIEVDGIVDDHDIEEDIRSHPNEVIVSSELRNDSEIYFDNTTVGKELNMNLPDLLSRAITFTNGSKMYLCFSKRCRKQLCFEGHLYNIDGFVKPTNWNLWRCANPSCSGAIRTSPNITELRVREPHSHLCRPEDIQIRLRITVYDLRLMAEFTDLPLDVLYHAYLDKVMDEHTDIVHLFPPFETLKANLEEHRNHLIYRKRFVAEARQSDTHCIYDDSFGVAANSTRFRRTKPFPPSLCMNCNAEFRSMPEIPSQDQLLEHIFFDHNRKTALTNRFTFDDPGLFEQWIRELQYHSKYRLKKMCLHDEHMYYLCQNDVRHFKSNHTRSAIPDMHCTAFVRVHDWRLIIQREVNEVVVDYCLEHIFHNEESADPLAPYGHADLFTPEVFIRDLAARRERTQQLIQDKGLQRIKRRNQAPSIFLNSSIQKSRRADTVPGDSSVFLTHKNNMENLNAKEGDSCGSVFDASRSQKRQKTVQQMQERYQFRVEAKRLHPLASITRRENFTDSDTYDSVLHFEISCDLLKERMQYARNNRIANHYLGRLTRIVDDVMADPFCAPLNVSENDSGMIEPSIEDIPNTTKIPKLHGLSSLSTVSQVVESNEILTLSREAKSEPDESLPVCQKVLVRKGDNGQLVVVRRTILGKVRKITNDGEMRPTERGSFVEVCTPNKTVRSTYQSGEANRSSKSVETRSSSNCGDKECEASLTTGDLLRDVLYPSRTPRYEQMSLRGVRRMAYQSMAQQNNAYVEEAREFIRKFSDHQNSRLKADETNAVRSIRGRPRKYP